MDALTISGGRTRAFFELLANTLRRQHDCRFLDPRELPDHLKRDIGLLDGHEVPGDAGDQRAPEEQGNPADRSAGFE